MTSTMGIILSETNLFLNSLTEKRSIAALPFAGRYRLIDFTLSNMVNSGIINVGILLKYKYSSLMDHLGSGKEWDLSRKNGGLHILPPFSGRSLQGLGEGNIDLLATAESYIRRRKEEYIVLSEGNIIANIDIGEVKKFHKEKNADITLVYYEEIEANNRTLSNHTILAVDENNRIDSIEVSPRRPKSKNIFMKMLIIKRDFLLNAIDEAVARGEHDIMKDILIKSIDSTNVFAYKFDGYVRSVYDVGSYYDANMDMLKEEIRKEIFNPRRPIYTKIKDQVPSRYCCNASVHNSLIADGCEIEGEVKDSIIFRGVNIGKNAKISNSIVMQDSIIQAGCELSYTILDKEVTIRDGGRLVGELNHPMIIGKGEVV